ncbi:ABC transporter ATP-binding protein/permease, partial [Klebsiella pneumoniae]|nr:ABC transporter ATP-binding protein/permease [Klebsiella pneumoniae]MCP6663439.1 ABC transporter ATP-binding protein/permease [Klebsiella pneumoniae]
GKPLTKLNFDQQRYEADFRFSLVRLRENSESIAFYGGEAREGQSFMDRFGSVLDNFWQIMKRQKQLTWFTSGYAQIAVIVPLLLAAPRYFAKEIQLGGLVQTSLAFGKVQ